jgi:hypothetical protein
MARACEGQNAASVEFALRNAAVQQNWRCFAAGRRNLAVRRAVPPGHEDTGPVLHPQPRTSKGTYEAVVCVAAARNLCDARYSVASKTVRVR